MVKEIPSLRLKSPNSKKSVKKEWVGIRERKYSQAKPKSSKSDNKKASKKSLVAQIEQSQTTLPIFEEELSKLPIYERLKHQKKISDYKLEKQRMERNLLEMEEEAKTLTFQPNLHRQQFFVLNLQTPVQNPSGKNSPERYMSPKRIGSKSPEPDPQPVQQSIKASISPASQLLSEKYLRSTSSDVFERLRTDLWQKSPNQRLAMNSSEVCSFKPVLNKNFEELSLRKKAREQIVNAIVNDTQFKESSMLKTPARSPSPEFERSSGIKNPQPTTKQSSQGYQIQPRRDTAPSTSQSHSITDGIYLKLILEVKQQLVSSKLEENAPTIDSYTIQRNNMQCSENQHGTMDEKLKSESVKAQNLAKGMPKVPPLKLKSQNPSSKESKEKLFRFKAEKAE